MLHLASDDCFTACKIRIWTSLKKATRSSASTKVEMRRQSREDGGQLFNADMAGRHHDCSIFGHSGSGDTSRHRGQVSFLGLDQHQPYCGDADHISAHSFWVRVCCDIGKNMFSSSKDHLLNC